MGGCRRREWRGRGLVRCPQGPGGEVEASTTCSLCSLHSEKANTEQWFEDDDLEWNAAGRFCYRNEGADSWKGNAGPGQGKTGWWKPLGQGQQPTETGSAPSAREDGAETGWA